MKFWLSVGALAVCALLIAMRMVYVESASFPDRSGMPLLASTALERVADLPDPPGNIAVFNDDTFFFTFHPEASPAINLARWHQGRVTAFPDIEWQPGGDHKDALNEVLSVRLHGNELWVLDNGRHGFSSVRLLAFNAESGEFLQQYRFPRRVFPLGSHANDFRISADGRYFFITDASLFSRTPALVVYDQQSGSSRRILEGHRSVAAGAFQPVVQGRAMTLFGLFTINPGVDGIALDSQNQWLYFASVSADQMYRLAVADAVNPQLSAAELAGRTEALGEKTMTDGIAIDRQGNLYLSDLENSAIVRRTPDGELQTLLRSADLRWPDGFSLHGDYLYVTCSALHQVLGRHQDDIRAAGPFQIYRINLAAARLALEEL
jgi:sugar lactone lactonase YvrE